MVKNSDSKALSFRFLTLYIFNKEKNKKLLMQELAPFLCHKILSFSNHSVS